jgi:hypothetical protein
LTSAALVCDFHAFPQFQVCQDCGIDAWGQQESGRVAHEDFYVHDDLWDAVRPDDAVEMWEEDGVTFREGQFVLCIGCFEDPARKAADTTRLQVSAQTSVWRAADISVSVSVEGDIALNLLANHRYTSEMICTRRG